MGKAEQNKYMYSHIVMKKQFRTFLLAVWHGSGTGGYITTHVTLNKSQAIP
mgnify:CR=1 FL=1